MGNVEASAQSPAPVEEKIPTPPVIEPVEEPKAEPQQRRGRKPKPSGVSVTDIVLYVTATGTVRPAIVTRVNSDDTVDLSVFNSEGCVAATKVREADADDLEEHSFHRKD